MPTNLGKSDKKKSLLAYREKLLGELKYYDQRIDEAQKNLTKIQTYEDENSSDSDVELPQILEQGSSIVQLKNQESMLKTCFQASQELTSLELLQHEMNVLTEAPVIEGELPKKEDGSWREVTAECCIDLIPFAITFYIFQANRKFAPLEFSSVKVVPLKTAQEMELMRSVLPGMRRPSDAVEVLRSYAAAYRSRRSSMARLADKFGSTLFMEPLPEGGYILKVGSFLEICWTLQNKWSPIAPFHHRMKINVEHLDKQYFDVITQAHMDLSKPTVDTDERTLLLAKIITTCLQAQPLVESSDQEEIENLGRVEKRRTTLDREPDMPSLKRSKDSEVMAPPRSIPKKVKPKTQQSETHIKKAAKRSVDDENSADNNKKIKTSARKQAEHADHNDEVRNDDEDNDETLKTVRSVASNKNSQDHNSGCALQDVASKDKEVLNAEIKTLGKKESVGTEKSNKMAAKEEETKLNEINEAKDTEREVSIKPGVAEKNNKIATKKVETKVNKNIPKTNVKKVDNKKNSNQGEVESQQKIKKNIKNDENIQNTDPASKIKNVANKDKAKILETRKCVAVSKSTTALKPSSAVSKNDSNPNANKNPVVKSKTSKLTKDKEVDKKVISKTKVTSETDANQETADKDAPRNVATEHNKVKSVASSKTVDKNKNVDGIRKTIDKVKKPVEAAKNVSSDQNKAKNVASSKTTDNNVDGTKKTAIDKLKKPLNEQNHKDSKTVPTKTSNALSKAKISTITTTTSIKKSTSNTEKENAIQKKGTMSKIPQKKTTSPRGVIKKMPLRVSPRKPLKVKTPLVGVNMKKIVQKTVTAIPRLMTKLKPKVT